MILQKLLGPQGVFDQHLGSGELQAAWAAFSRGEWEPAQVLMEAPGDRSLAVAGLAVGGIPTANFERYAQAHPGSAGHTLLAVRLTKAAWEIRGSGYAETVKQASWQGFHDMLMRAQEAGVHAIKLGPPSADAHAAMMVIGRGLSSGLGQIEYHFEEAHDLVPFHDSATAAMFQARCNKWFGTHEAMFSFARWIADEAPPGASVQWAIPLAHFERWLSMIESRVTRKHYFSQGKVRQEIASAARKFLAATPAGRAEPELLLALNWLVLGLASGTRPEKPLIVECVHRIDGRVTEFPWKHLANKPAFGYRGLVRQAL